MKRIIYLSKGKGKVKVKVKVKVYSFNKCRKGGGGGAGGVLGQGFCVLRGSFARCFAEVAALFALSGEAGAVNMRGVKRFSMRVR